MTSLAATASRALRILPRASLILLMLAAPVLAVPVLRGGEATIEAPAIRKGSGMGFVLLVSLRRN